MTARARFSQADVRRALRAAEAAGLCVGRIRIEPDGAIEIVAGQGETPDNAAWFKDSPLYRNKAA